jgi:hypothetical protein
MKLKNQKKKDIRQKLRAPVRQITLCKALLSISIIIFSGCEQWGYRGGPSYFLMKSNDVYFLCSTKTVEWNRNVDEKISLYFYKGEKLLDWTIIPGQSNSASKSYSVPDSLTVLTDSLKLNVIIDDRFTYDIQISREGCMHNDTVWAFERQYKYR